MSFIRLAAKVEVAMEGKLARWVGNGSNMGYRGFSMARWSSYSLIDTGLHEPQSTEQYGL